MTLRVLLIDDRADEFKQEIEQSLQSLGVDFRLDLCTDNHDSQVEEALKGGYDLIVLDWIFPDGPPGEETLKLIRGKGFKGSIILHSVGYRNFGQYVGKDMADAYVWRGLGDSALTDTLNRCIQAVNSRQASGIQVGHTFDLPWYETLDAMERHAYHGRSTEPGVPATERERSRKFVSLLTTDWDEETKAAKPNAMGKVIQTIERMAKKDNPVLILGPSGTGKELVAKLLHYHHKSPPSPGVRDRFVAKNCAAFPDKTLNIELFGSLPGAFTGAVEKAGIFEQVTEYDPNGNPTPGGTVFLDEVGIMKKDTQEHLLRVLEDHEVLRMGSDLTKTQGKPNSKIEKVEARLYGKIPVRFRIISATNEDLKQKKDRGKFRLDLYYRMLGVRIDMPSLVNRPIHDFNLLFQFFLHRFNHRYECRLGLDTKGTVLAERSRSLMVSLYTNSTWEGNVRQLENVVGAIVAYQESPDGRLTLDNVPEFLMREMFSRE